MQCLKGILSYPILSWNFNPVVLAATPSRLGTIPVVVVVVVSINAPLRMKKG